jgi:hypothetical protein
MSRLQLKCLGIKKFFRASARLFKRAWYGDVHFERRAVTEFSVAEKESAMNFHKMIKRVHGVNAVV